MVGCFYPPLNMDHTSAPPPPSPPPPSSPPPSPPPPSPPPPSPPPPSPPPSLPRPPDIRFVITPGDPDTEADQVAYLFHQVPYTLTFNRSSGHSLAQTAPYDLRHEREVAIVVAAVAVSVVDVPRGGPRPRRCASRMERCTTTHRQQKTALGHRIPTFRVGARVSERRSLSF